MTDIANLPNVATALAVTDLIVISQGGVTKQGATRIVQAMPMVVTDTATGVGVTLVAAQAGGCFTNEGVTARQDYTLPSGASIGQEFDFYCADNDGIRVICTGLEAIRSGASASSTAGYIESTAIGSYLKLRKMTARSWVSTAQTGTWSLA